MTNAERTELFATKSQEIETELIRWATERGMLSPGEMLRCSLEIIAVPLAAVEGPPQLQDCPVIKRGTVFYYDRALTSVETQDILSYEWSGWQQRLVNFLLKTRNNDPTTEDELSRLIDARFTGWQYATPLNQRMLTLNKPYGLIRVTKDRSNKEWRFYIRKNS